MTIGEHYDIVIAKSPERLVALVCEKIQQEAKRPLGPPFWVNGWYHQAMVTQYISRDMAGS